MATPQWQPGRLYPPGSIVLPRTAPSSDAYEITNPDFEQGDVGWAKGQGWAINNQRGFTGNWCAMLIGEGLGRKFISEDRHPVKPGQRFQAQCYVQPTRSSDSAALLVVFFNEAGEVVSEQQGGLMKGNHGWRVSKASNPAGFSVPAGAATVALGVIASKYSNSFLGADSFSWSLRSEVQAGLMYRAVQPASGVSDSTEPAWPGQLGLQVVDNQVIWEAVSLSRVVWEARPLLTSGATEPAWPTEPGARVADGSISWEAVSRRVTDPNCPNSDVVIIAKGKVFAGDGDIVRYSATSRPDDWTTIKDAGFLPTGMNQYGANPVSAMGLYRSDIVVWNSQGSQVWQVDPDPEQMGHKDSFPIGAMSHDSVSPVANDLFFLTPLGVRSVGIAGGSTNLQAGDAGIPIDPLVQAKLTSAAKPRALYHPAQGQYWLIFEDEVFVYTINQLGEPGKWSRYVFPFAIEDFTIKGAHLFLRHGDVVSRVDPELDFDELPGGEQRTFDWVIQWPWLDLGSLGVTKMLVGFDIVGIGESIVEFGYDQSNGGIWTDPWPIVADSVPGQILAFPISAPSLAVRLTYNSAQPGARWEALNLYFQPLRTTA